MRFLLKKSKPNKRQKAAILITTLWMVVILTALCVSVGRRSAVALRVSLYQSDKLKSRFYARAGIMRALAQKRIQYKKGISTDIDALSEKWANDAQSFKEQRFEDGQYSVSYSLRGEKSGRFASTSEKGVFLYGLSDEASRININKACAKTLSRLINLCGINEAESEEIASAIIDWRDEDDFVYGEEDFGRARGAENAYYQGLVPPYSCKNKDFEILEELLLVKGVTHKLYYGKDEDGKIKYALKDFLTVYGEGSVNINTAPEPVLSALFGEDFKELASKVCAYRRGADGIIGTKDDRWFSIGSYAIDRQDMGLVAVKNLKDPDWLGNMYGITNDEYARIKKMISSGDIKLCAKSDIYRAYSTGKVRKVMTEIEAVYKFSEDEDYPRLLFWHEQ